MRTTHHLTKKEEQRKIAQRQTIKAGPREFSKIHSLGQLSGMSQFKLLKANLYDVEQIQLPMTQSEFSTRFPGTKKMFDLLSDTPCPGRQTNAGTGMTVEAPFLLTGVGLLAIGEGYGFTLPGIVTDKPATPEPLPGNSGCVADCASGDRNAALSYGYPTWSILQKFFQAYRAQMYIGRHFQLFDEAAFDIGVAATTPEFVGASDSLISAMPFVREVNDQMDAKGMDKVFVPPNIAIGANGTECIGAPTAGVTWGATHTPGVANRLYQLNMPVLWLPGMTLDLRLTEVENDCCFRSAMLRDAVVDPSNPTKPSAAFTEEIEGGVGCGSVFTIPGGCFSLGMILTGYDITLGACVEYLTTVPDGGAMEEMYANLGVGAVAALINNPALKNQLGSLPIEEQEKLNRFAR